MAIDIGGPSLSVCPQICREPDVGQPKWSRTQPVGSCVKVGSWKVARGGCSSIELQYPLVMANIALENDHLYRLSFTTN